MFENPRRGWQARNFTTNVPKILDLKSSSEQIFSRKLSLGAPGAGLVNLFEVRGSAYILEQTLQTLGQGLLQIERIST